MPPTPPPYDEYEGEFYKMKSVDKPTWKEQVKLFFRKWYQGIDLDKSIWVFKVMDNTVYFKQKTCWSKMSHKQYKEAFGLE